MTATKQILIVDDDRETCRLIAELVGAPDRTIVGLIVQQALAVSTCRQLRPIRH